MFENITEKISGSFKKLRGNNIISNENIQESLKEIRMSLLEADVNYKVVKTLISSIEEKAVGQEVIKSISPSEQFIKIFNDELIDLLGSKTEQLNIKVSPPAVIMMAGLQGSGKTTFSGKLALYLKKKHAKKPLLVACDVYRPAAIDQLGVVAAQVGATIYEDREEKSPVKIAKAALEVAKKDKHDLVIIDTAGRLAVDKVLMDEIKAIHQAIKPSETLFVVDSMTGQDAVNTAKAFNDILNFDGVVLTKLDGDTRGGAALSIKSVVDKPIKFMGTGEKMEALDMFYPDRMADRILGMGDVVSLVERAQEQFDQDQARKINKKIAKNQFSFDDFLSQIQQVKKMGNMKDLMGMIPGVGKMVKDVDIDDNAFQGIEVIIGSMTPKERSQPKLLNHSRKMRIAKGSGTTIQEVNQLIKQFEQMSKMMKMMQGGKGKHMMQMLQNMK